MEFTKLFCFYTMATQVMHARVYFRKKEALIVNIQNSVLPERNRCCTRVVS